MWCENAYAPPALHQMAISVRVWQAPPPSRGRQHRPQLSRITCASSSCSFKGASLLRPSCRIVAPSSAPTHGRTLLPAGLFSLLDYFLALDCFCSGLFPSIALFLFTDSVFHHHRCAFCFPERVFMLFFELSFSRRERFQLLFSY